MTPTDNLTYAIIVEHVPGQGAQVRRRWMVYDGLPETVAEVARWHRMRGNHIAWMEGKLGSERTRVYAEGGEIFKLDGSGCPVLIGGTS